MLALIFTDRPHVYHAIRHACQAMWLTTPFIVTSMALSLGYVFRMRRSGQVGRLLLPPYPAPSAREHLLLVVGELHKARKSEPVARPSWLTIPHRRLWAGIAVFGAVGSGKTTCCMYPFAERILAYRHTDPDQRAGALILEVKGDFCYRVQETLRKYGRESDYVEISLDCEYRYNPLHNDLEAYALAYGIASLLNNLFGNGKEPSWQQTSPERRKYAMQPNAATLTTRHA